MVAFMPGLISGLNKYYKDKASTRVTGNAVHVNFG
jgi:hypothetical protein